MQAAYAATAARCVLDALALSRGMLAAWLRDGDIGPRENSAADVHDACDAQRTMAVALHEAAQSSACCLRAALQCIDAALPALPSALAGGANVRHIVAQCRAAIVAHDAMLGACQSAIDHQLARRESGGADAGMHVQPPEQESEQAPAGAPRDSDVDGYNGDGDCAVQPVTAADIGAANQPASPASMPRSLPAAAAGVGADAGGDTCDVEVVVPGITFADVDGMQAVKQALLEALVLPRTHPHLFRGIRQPWRSLLLYGPPGTGKTMIACAAAGEARLPLLRVSAASLLSRWVGGSERRVRAAFAHAAAVAPAVLFVDEIDALCMSRDHESDGAARRVLTQFLLEMSSIVDVPVGCEDPRAGLTVVACTNRLHDIDAALLRRFELHIGVPPPGLEQRAAMLRRFLHDVIADNSRSSFDWFALAKHAEGITTADLRTICKRASMRPLHDVTQCTAIDSYGCAPRDVSVDDVLAEIAVTVRATAEP